MKVNIVNDDNSNGLFFLRGSHSSWTFRQVGIVTLPKNEHRVFRILDVAPFVDQQHTFAIL